MSTEMTIVAVMKMIYIKILQHLPEKTVFFIKISLKLLFFLSFSRNLSEQENKKKNEGYLVLFVQRNTTGMKQVTRNGQISL